MKALFVIGAALLLTAAHAASPGAEISDNCALVFTKNGEKTVLMTGMIAGIRVQPVPAQKYLNVKIIMPEHGPFTTSDVGMWPEEANTFVKRYQACSGMALPKGYK